MINGIETPKENWTKIPNCFLDRLSEFTPYEVQVFCLVIRGAGYSNPNHRYSARYVALKTGMSKSQASRALAGLVSKNALTKHGSVESTGTYSIRWVSQTIDGLDEVSTRRDRVSPARDAGVPPEGQKCPPAGTIERSLFKDHNSKIIKREREEEVFDFDKWERETSTEDHNRRSYNEFGSHAN